MEKDSDKSCFDKKMKSLMYGRVGEVSPKFDEMFEITSSMMML
jgi:hypothetical protein